jgi:adenosylmethionine-8-amino-7-oxononanoate aminotransferase
VKDKDTKTTFNAHESEELLRGFLSGALYERGLICRTDDRGDPVIQLSPPLIADSEQFEEIEGILRPVLTEAWERLVPSEAQVKREGPGDVDRREPRLRA